jgi:peptidyl-prolyl cis-trans isomerase A (cyclophilin A)
MKLKLASGIVCGLILTFAVIGTPLKAQQKKKPGLYATLQTSDGTIVCELFEKEAPITVKNFTELGEGKKKYKDPRDGQEKTGHYYDGTIFHRVIPGFMIQGGDPTGTGMGDPGYKFQNESAPNIKFDKPGRLAMANSGRDTNGSQFFITDGPVQLSEKDYTIFGQVVEGLDIVAKIAREPKATKDNPEGSKPLKPVVLQKVTIERVPAGS